MSSLVILFLAIFREILPKIEDRKVVTYNTQNTQESTRLNVWMSQNVWVGYLFIGKNFLIFEFFHIFEFFRPPTVIFKF